MRRSLPFVLAVALAACGGEKRVVEVPVVPSDSAEPAEEVSEPTETAEAPEAAEPAAGEPTAEPEDEAAPEAGPDAKKWAGYLDHLPFVIGADKGIAEAKKQGKPALFFYAATW